MALMKKKTGLNDDAVDVFEDVISRHDNCFLFETLGGGQQSAAYIGAAPRNVYEGRQGICYVDGTPVEGAAFEHLRHAINGSQVKADGFNGGLVGYVAHEALSYVEPSLTFAYDRMFPDFQFGKYDDGLIFQGAQPPIYFFNGENRLGLYRPGPRRTTALHITYEQAAKSRPQYEVMVEKARDDIRAGRVFQAVLANRYEYRFTGELFKLYKELRRVNPSPFMFFLKFGDRITMGASPELLLKVSGGTVHVEALAGTVPRGQTDKEDAELAARLEQDEKEIAEHSMLVDLYRNDVGRVAKTGTVKIDDLMYIKKLSHVQHLCSLISGKLDDGCDMFDAFKAVFPAGTLVGAPKIEAAKMIAELEGYERGPFGGSVGYFGYGGESMHAVNIRAVNAAGSRLYLHTGSGIVYDSRPDREYKEINAKKAAMDKAMADFMYGDVG